MIINDEPRASDADVEPLATKMMPTVEEHLTSAKSMPKSKGGGGMASTTDKGVKAPVTGEANDHTSPGAVMPPPAAKDTSRGTSGTAGTTGTSTTPPVTGEANDHTSPGAVRPSPAAKDTKPAPAPAVKY